MEIAYNLRDDEQVLAWGQQRPEIQWRCRVNGPGGNVACSVPNTVRVAFYGPQMLASNENEWVTSVQIVSWRDDRGVPHPDHEIDTRPDLPGKTPLRSPLWKI
jgi:hypothetical protein